MLPIGEMGEVGEGGSFWSESAELALKNTFLLARGGVSRQAIAAIRLGMDDDDDDLLGDFQGYFKSGWLEISERWGSRKEEVEKEK